MSDIELLLRMLSRRDELTAEETRLLTALPKRRRVFARGETIIPSHAEPVECGLLVEGFAGREIMVGDGGRQLTAIRVPGDLLDLCTLLMRVTDHAVVALTPCVVTFVAHRDLLQLVERSPHLGRLLWLTTTLDGAIQRNMSVSVGRRDALTRMANLICDLYHRLEIVGLADRHAMRVPLSQATLGDLLGISAVHVNRTLQTLRRRKVVGWNTSGDVVIRDYDRLAATAGFDPVYLNLVKLPR